MSLLIHIPTDTDLMRLYWELSRLGAISVGKKIKWDYRIENKEHLIAVSGEMTRYDPRLLSILIQFFLKHYHQLNPFILRKYISHMRSPQVFGVIREFVNDYSADTEMNFFFDYIIKGLKPVIPQMFFLGIYSMGSEKQIQMVKRSLKEYVRWGYLGMERPQVEFGTKKTVGKYSFETRMKIIDDIIHHAKQITMRSYLQVLDFTISRQQALYDFKHHPHLKIKGRGRGAAWIVF